MECFIRRVLEGRSDARDHQYFVRFGKGIYGRRFLMKFDVGKKIKMKGSFELANDFVRFVRSLKAHPFSGKLFTKEKIAGLEGRKKAGVFVYEVEGNTLEAFEHPYFALVDASDTEITLKIKKSLPKPGKDELKVDEGFCVLELDLKYLSQVKDAFFWDVPNCKKALIEHELQIREILFPAGEKDPVKIRELAKRKGTIVRKMQVDGKDLEKKYEVEA